MTAPQLVFPARLGWIDRQKTDQSIGMGCDIIGYVLVIDPDAAEPRLATEDDRADLLRGGPLIIFEPHRQIDLNAGPRPPRLSAEVVGKVPLIIPSVAVNVDDHAEASKSLPGGLH